MAPPFCVMLYNEFYVIESLVSAQFKTRLPFSSAASTLTYKASYEMHHILRIFPQSLFIFFCISVVLPSVAFGFDIYVETNFKGQPDFEKYGLKDGSTHLGAIYETNMFGKGRGPQHQFLPPKERVIEFTTRKYANYIGLFVADIESWALTGSDKKVSDNVKKYLTVLEWIKSAAPKATVGYYGKPPIANYSATQKGQDHKKYQNWQRNNDRIAPLANAVDILFPSLYPVNENRDGWVRYAIGQISEARRLGKGKKVYPFINPRYHSRARNKFGLDLAFDPVPQDYFLLQLKTLKQYADSVVIWDWSGRPWNEQEPWWRATLEFLASESSLPNNP